MDCSHTNDERDQAAVVGPCSLCMEARIERLTAALRGAEDMLARAEGYFAAAAYTEQHSPPFERGRKWQELVDIRDLLADLQKSRALAGKEG